MTAHEAGRYGRVRVEAPKTNDQLRQLITGGMKCPVFSFSKHSSLSDAMYMIQRADRDRAHIAGPPQGDAERSDALRGQHTPAVILPSP